MPPEPERSVTPQGTPGHSRSAVVRAIWLALGLLFVSLGFVGVFLPVLPTAPFLILAAACFARSSTRLEARLLSHPVYGPMLRDWRARGAIPRRAKWLSLAGTSFGFVLFLWGSHPGWPLIVAVGGLMLFGVGYVFSRPDA